MIWQAQTGLRFAIPAHLFSKHRTPGYSFVKNEGISGHDDDQFDIP